MISQDRAKTIEANLINFIVQNIETENDRTYLCTLLAITARNGLVQSMGRKKAYEILCTIADKVI